MALQTCKKYRLISGAINRSFQASQVVAVSLRTHSFWKTYRNFKICYPHKMRMCGEITSFKRLSLRHSAKFFRLRSSRPRPQAVKSCWPVFTRFRFLKIVLEYQIQFFDKNGGKTVIYWNKFFVNLGAAGCNVFVINQLKLSQCLQRVKRPCLKW